MQCFLLGTAAAEGYPGTFCECERCQHTLAAGGKNHRLRAAALINNDLLIDFGPDLLAALQRHRITLAQVRTLLITHFHDDHWYAQNLFYRHRWFTEQELPLMHIYGGPRLEEEVLALCDRHNITVEDLAIQLHTIQSGEEATSDAYTIRAFPAAHTPNVDPQLYMITQGEKKLVYATDTGPFSEEAYQAVRNFGANLLIMELTMGGTLHDTHMGRADFMKVTDRMKKESALAPDAKIVATHFSHHYTPSHETLEAELANLGIIAGYDGFIIDT